MNQDQDKAYSIKTNQVWQTAGVEVGFSELIYHSQQKIQGGNDDDSVRLHFGIRGDYAFYYRELDQYFDLIGGHHNLLYSSPFHIEVSNKTSYLSTFGVKFPRALFLDMIDHADGFLKDFAEGVVEGKAVILSNNWGAITTEIQQVIDQVVRNPFTGILENTYVYAKALELLVLSVQQIEQQTQSFAYIKNNHDKAQLIAARDYINDRMFDPPNLTEVARAVGLNEFKLKHGFKELFGTTLFNYLTERRLHLAKEKLLYADQTITELAEEMGYSSPQHFHSQFKKRFGITPNSIRKDP